MKATLVTVALINLAVSSSFGDSSKDSNREGTQAKTPEPAPRHQVHLPKGDENIEIYVLKPVKVKAERDHFVFEHERYQDLNEKPFTWKDGGILSRHEGKHFTTKFGIQYDARNKGISFLNISF